MSTNLIHEHRFPSAVALAHALAAEIKVDLTEAIAARGSASLVVSGGRTPEPFFRELRTETTDWGNVSITLADERWVDTASEQSNERFVREVLLQDKASTAHFIGLKNTAATPEQGVEWAWRSIKRIARPFDAVLLGMGDDGHFASLFPGSLGLVKALDLTATPGCVAMNALTAPHARISLNLSALLDARRIVLLLGGAEKWKVYERARQAGSSSELPIRALLQQKQVTVDVYWSP
jgi:6-phosphogluconolactonase